MKKKFLFLILLFFLVIPIFGCYSTEVIYPTIPKTISPQEISSVVSTEAEVFPLFMNYLFRLLMIVSLSIVVLVICYAGLLYILSSGDPVKTRFAKDWILSAIQGAFIIFLSYAILFTIDSRFVLFRQIDLRPVNPLDGIDLDWTIKSMYFQIPVGLIIEDAVLNETSQEKINNVFHRITKSEHTGEKIERTVEEYLSIIGGCSGNGCVSGGGIPPGVGPEDPNNRPGKINVFADPINLITAKVYLNHDIYNFIDTSRNGFVLPINSWQRGDIILGGPNTPGGISSNDFNAINGAAIRVFGEDRIATEMALRLAIKYDKGDSVYGSLNVNYLNPMDVNKWKILARFTWSTSSTLVCPEGAASRVLGDGKIIINPLLNIQTSPGKGFIVIRVEGSNLCPPVTIWSKDSSGWVLYCVKEGINYINNLDTVYGNISYKVDCPTTLGIIEGLGWVSYEILTPPTPPGMCPNTIYRTLELSVEIDYYNNHLLLEIQELMSKEGEDVLINLHQITKIMALKSLGKDEIITYTSYLQERLYYDRESVVITTDSDWARWVVEGEPNISDIYYNTNKTKNDSTTFYLRVPVNNNIINAALLLAENAKKSGFTNINITINNNQSFLLNTSNQLFSSLESFFSNLIPIVFAQSEIDQAKECLKEKIKNITLPENNAEKLILCIEKIEACFSEKNLDENILSDQSAVTDLLGECEMGDISSLFDGGNHVQCGTEIPIGEVISITWNHLFDTISEIKKYYNEGLKLIEKHDTLKGNALLCNCACSSVCTLSNCETQKIEEDLEEILKIREKMITAKENLHDLTFKFLNTPTENICSPLNVDIRIGEEVAYCLSNTTKNIKKHELILRKLYHSRSQFDGCQNFNMSAVIAGEVTSKSNIFGPTAEKNNLPRITKTKIGNELVNTSDFNWFCCTD